jgi:HPt (histidine-containing phosphotransfer) domain-containing protein
MKAHSYRAIDPDVLLTAAGDLETYRALARTFVDCAPDISRRLLLALGAGDYPTIASKSHALKGMTVLVGAAQLTTLLQRMESAARLRQDVAGAGSDLTSQFDLVMREVAASIRHFDQLGHDDATRRG